MGGDSVPAPSVVLSTNTDEQDVSPALPDGGDLPVASVHGSLTSVRHRLPLGRCGY